MQRLKKILKWTGIVLGGLVAILLLVNAWLVWRSDVRLEGQLAAIRAAGDPVTLADLARKPIPPDQNAATYLRQAEADIQAMEKEFEPYYDWLHKNSDDALMPSEMQKVVQAVFAAHPKVFPLLEQAAACPDYDAQLDYAIPGEAFMGSQSIPVMDKCRSAARVLHNRAHLLVSVGKRDEAVRTAMANLRLTRHFEHNPFIVGHLVAVAVQALGVSSANSALQAGPVSQSVRDALDAELARHESAEGYIWAIKSERVFINAMPPISTPTQRLWICRAFFNRMRSDCLDALQAMLAAAREATTYAQTEQRFAEIGRTSSRMASLLFPATKAFYSGRVRSVAFVRTLRVLNAIQTHVPAGSDAMPKLSELGLPAEATIDPFNGEPLHVKKLPQGWMVYSVGDNLKDDGGILDFSHDVGVGPVLPDDKPTENSHNANH